MAWEEPKAGRWRCERCGKQSETAEGWLRLEIAEEDEETVAHDVCALCKTQVRKTIKGLLPYVPKVAS